MLGRGDAAGHIVIAYYSLAMAALSLPALWLAERFRPPPFPAQGT
jgi:hypothetical protein